MKYKKMIMNDGAYEKYVRQVAKDGSLTKAAEKIGVSQPALSSGLTALEKKLGFAVFDRSQSPVVLTEAGKIYLDFINRKKSLTADFQTRIEACLSDRDFRAAIGSPVVYSESIVSKAVYQLLTAHPEYSVSIRTAPLKRLIEMTEDGELDCFISTRPDLPEYFLREPVKPEHIYLCVPAAFPVNGLLKKNCGDKLSFADFRLLQTERFILLEPDQPIRMLLDEFLAKEDIVLKENVCVNQVSSAVNLAVMGLGCCFASEDALSDHSVREKLCVYSLPEDASGRWIYVVSHRDHYRSRAAAELMSFLTEPSAASERILSEI